MTPIILPASPGCGVRSRLWVSLDIAGPSINALSHQRQPVDFGTLHELICFLLVLRIGRRLVAKHVRQAGLRASDRTVNSRLGDHHLGCLYDGSHGVGLIDMNRSVRRPLSTHGLT